MSEGKSEYVTVRIHRAARAQLETLKDRLAGGQAGLLSEEQRERLLAKNSSEAAYSLTLVADLAIDLAHEQLDALAADAAIARPAPAAPSTAKPTRK
jgi:hypothetical protein